jgi:hypothetical protein
LFAGVPQHDQYRFRPPRAPANRRQLTLRKERRRYELGWILRSIGGRNNCSELTERPEFAVLASP